MDNREVEIEKFCSEIVYLITEIRKNENLKLRVIDIKQSCEKPTSGGNRKSNKERKRLMKKLARSEFIKLHK